MPVSRRRKKPTPLSPTVTTAPKRKGPSPRWLAPLMLVLFGLGILWLVVYYLSPPGQMPLTGDLGGWNLVIGFGFIILGFILSTQWR